MIEAQHYFLLKSLHIFGIILFLGNIIVTAFWKTFADFSNDWKIISFSQRLVTYTDIFFTALGVFIIAITNMINSYLKNIGRMKKSGWYLV